MNSKLTEASPPRRALWRAATGLSATLLAALLPAQEGRFEDLISVTEVQVPVRVLVKGEPVRGLTLADFELYDRGEPQVLTGFEVQYLGPKRASGRPAKGEGRPVAVGRRLLMLFDFGFSRPNRLARAVDGLRRVVDEQLNPGDRMALATHGRVSGLNLLIGFTADRGRLHLALDAVEAMLDANRALQRQLLEKLHAARFAAAAPPDRPSVYQRLAEELGSAAALALLAGPVDDPEGESFFAPIRARVEIDVSEPIDVVQERTSEDDVGALRAFALALSELTTLLREVRGHKELLLLSEGFGGRLLRDGRSLYFIQEMFRALRSANWTLHSVDVGGVPSLDEEFSPSDSLLFFAEATGGDLVENFNDVSRATSRIFRRSSLVYVLSFQPSSAGEEGQFRDIEVRLRRRIKGARIAHRPGYYVGRPTSKREPYERRVDAAEWLLTNLEAKEIGVEVFAQTLSDPLGGVRVPVTVEVDGKSLLSLRTRKATWLELQLAVLDAEGEAREMLIAKTRIDFDDLEQMLEQGGVRFIGELGVPPGEYRMRVLVRSTRRGEVYLAGLALAVGPELESGLSPPAASDARPASTWVTVQAQRRSDYFQ